MDKQRYVTSFDLQLSVWPAEDCLNYNYNTNNTEALALWITAADFLLRAISSGAVGNALDFYF